ncbi:MAG: type II secretion system F family protein [Anaerolineae bacterium]
MNSSESSAKPNDKNSFKPISAFHLYYQLTYMAAMASAGLSRSRTFLVAAEAKSPVATYFAAINTLVTEFRYDYPEACRIVGNKAKSDNVKSFLLRLSDALRSGEPLAEFLTREAEIQGQDYQNDYERNMEGLKQWSNAFSSILMSVALIIIIQMVSGMIYSTEAGTMGGMVVAGIAMSGFGAFVIYRSAPREVMTGRAIDGSPEQRQALRLMRLLLPIGVMAGMVLRVIGLDFSFVLMIVAAMLLPIGIVSIRSDKKVIKKDVEFSTFLRSAGGMATSSGTTVKQALTRIDLTSFPVLEGDIDRLSKRLQARVEPEICWRLFGTESGSRLINEVVDIFYGAIKMGGDPEKVGYVCSLFVARTTALRSKRRLTASTFAGLATVMETVAAGLLVFVLSIINSFAIMVEKVMPKNTDALSSAPQMSLSMGQFSPSDLQFLQFVTILMVLSIIAVGAAAILACTGGLKLKYFFYLSLGLFIAGVSMLIVPPMVASLLKVNA